MYKTSDKTETTLNVNRSVEGQTIEQKIEQILDNKTPITDGAGGLFTERKDGVMPGYDIRTDRFEIAVEAMDKVQKHNIAKREERGKIVPMETPKKPENPESTGGEINT